MSRRRFAVALMIPAPAAIEVDALRRALDDRQLGRIGAHVTLVPPINLRDDEVTDAMVVVEAATARVAPFTLELGPVETFGRDSATRFLRVDPWEPVTALYEACWTGPLERPQKRPFHPHVTIDIDGSPTDDDDPAVALLAGFTTSCTIDRVTLLEHRVESDGAAGDERRWEPFSHFPLSG